MKTSGSKHKVSINWRSGFYRVGVVLWVLWAGFLFVGLPLQQIHSAQKYATNMYAYDLGNASDTEEAKAKREADNKERWAQASWSYVYKTEVIPNIWLYIGTTLLVPLMAYGLILSLAALAKWLYRGFTTTNKSIKETRNEAPTERTHHEL